MEPALNGSERVIPTPLMIKRRHSVLTCFIKSMHFIICLYRQFEQLRAAPPPPPPSTSLYPSPSTLSILYDSVSYFSSRCRCAFIKRIECNTLLELILDLWLRGIRRVKVIFGIFMVCIRQRERERGGTERDAIKTAFL